MDFFFFVTLLPLFITVAVGIVSALGVGRLTRTGGDVVAIHIQKAMVLIKNPPTERPQGDIQPYYVWADGEVRLDYLCTPISQILTIGWFNSQENRSEEIKLFGPKPFRGATTLRVSGSQGLVHRRELSSIELAKLEMILKAIDESLAYEAHKGSVTIFTHPVSS